MYKIILISMFMNASYAEVVDLSKLDNTKVIKRKDESINITINNHNHNDNSEKKEKCCVVKKEKKNENAHKQIHRHIQQHEKKMHRTPKRKYRKKKKVSYMPTTKVETRKISRVKENRTAYTFDLNYTKIDQVIEFGTDRKLDLLGAELGFRYAFHKDWALGFAVGKSFYEREDWRNVTTNLSVDVAFALTGTMRQNVRYTYLQSIVIEDNKIKSRKVKKVEEKKIDFSGLRVELNAGQYLIHGTAKNHYATGLGAAIYYEHSFGKTQDYFWRLGLRGENVQRGAIDFNQFQVFVGIGGWL